MIGSAIPALRSSHPGAVACIFAVITTMAAGGCVPSIGDSCKTAQDCPQNAICDSTAPDGYCTMEDCNVGDCPDRSICIPYDSETAYCMRHCDNDDDCRSGYVCREERGVPGYCYVPP